MPYVSSIERIALEKGSALGKLEGMAKAKADTLLRLLTKRFHCGAPPWPTNARQDLLELGEKSTTNNTNLTNQDGKLGYRVIARTQDHDELVAR
ncbi:MAG: hypothetical protein ACLQIB_52595 [Isosphaeraceae bacterium]